MLAIVSASPVSAVFLARFVPIASGIDGSSYFADPTAWNLAISSIRILVFPLVYLSAILLVQGRTVARLERTLAYDDLTGALSRRAFLDACARHFAQGSDAGAGTLLFLDLDHFKQLNDRHGHAVGDRALRHFVEVASAVLPPRASLGRLGGEEFAVLLPASARAASATVAEAIMQAVRDTPLDTGRALVPMTVSIGSAAARPGMALDDVLKRADDALYRRLDETAAALGKLTTEALSAAGVPHRLSTAGNMFSVFFTAADVHDYDSARTQVVPAFKAFFHAMLAGGVYLPPSAFESWFVSTAIDDAAWEQIAAALPVAARAAAAAGHGG